MNLLNTSVRILKYAYQHITRNLWQSAILVLVISVTFMVAQIFYIERVATESILSYFEDQPQVVVFFADTAQEDQILQIKAELEKDEKVSTVAYLSKEQAVEIYRSQHADNPELLEFVTPDILPASLEISVTDIDYLATVAAQFSENQFVEQVIYQPDLINELTNWTNAIRRERLVLLAVMVFVSAVIISLVFSNNLSTFQREIEVMRLVGAGNWYIRMPFIIDGVIFALLASVVSIGVIYYAYPNIPSFFNSVLSMTNFWPAREEILFDLWWMTALAGSGFTALVSFLSVWRHLKI